jgi:glutathione peroxidase
MKDYLKRNRTVNVFEHEVELSDGQKQKLEEYAGKAVLIVNVASKCGFTPQYEGLEELYRKYKDRGFEILAFPCNQFGGQEPGDAEEIANFCTLTYDVTFPLFAKIDVNGSNADPLYEHLRSQKRGLMGDRIKWNFTKFLVNGDGEVVERYAPTTKPYQIEKDIEALLA